MSTTWLFDPDRYNEYEGVYAKDEITHTMRRIFKDTVFIDAPILFKEGDAVEYVDKRSQLLVHGKILSIGYKVAFELYEGKHHAKPFYIVAHGPNTRAIAVDDPTLRLR